jgi:hypothetical protein
VWREELGIEWGAQRASKEALPHDKQHEDTDELAMLPTVVRPSADDLRYVKRRREGSRRGTLISSMRGTIKFRRPALPAPMEHASSSAAAAGGSSASEPRHVLLSKPKRAGAQGPSRHEALKVLAAETRVIRAINEATDTQTLNLSSCGIDELREEWFTATRTDMRRTLKSIDLGFNRFKWFPLQVLWFGQCLSTLCLDGNDLVELPPHIGLLHRTLESWRRGPLCPTGERTLADNLCCLSICL